MNTTPNPDVDVDVDTGTGDVAAELTETDAPKHTIRSRTSLIVGLSLTAVLLLGGGITTAVVMNNNAAAAAELEAAAAAQSLVDRYDIAAASAAASVEQIDALHTEIGTLTTKAGEKFAAVTKLNESLVKFNDKKAWISQTQQSANKTFTDEIAAITDPVTDSDVTLTAYVDEAPTFVVEPAPSQLAESNVEAAEQIAADASTYVADLTEIRDNYQSKLDAYDEVATDALALLAAHKAVMIGNYNGILEAYNLASGDVVTTYNSALNAALVDAKKADPLTFTTLKAGADQLLAAISAGTAVLDSHTATQAAANGDTTYTDVNGQVVEIPSAYVNPSVVPYVPSGPTWTPPGGGTTPPGGGTTPPGGGTTPTPPVQIPATFSTDGFFVPFGSCNAVGNGSHTPGWGGNSTGGLSFGMPWSATVSGPTVYFYACI